MGLNRLADPQCTSQVCQQAEAVVAELLTAKMGTRKGTCLCFGHAAALCYAMAKKPGMDAVNQLLDQQPKVAGQAWSAWVSAVQNSPGGTKLAATAADIAADATFQKRVATAARC